MRYSLLQCVLFQSYSWMHMHGPGRLQTLARPHAALRLGLQSWHLPVHELCAEFCRVRRTADQQQISLLTLSESNQERSVCWPLGL